MKRLLWFRRDLRVEDQPLLALGGAVLPIFIFDSNILEPLEKDDRRVGMIFALVSQLKERLRSLGLELHTFYGDPVTIIAALQQHFAFDEVAAGGDYDAYALERDRNVSHLLPFQVIHDTYIFTPQELLKSDGTPFLLFSPYYKRAKALFSAQHMMHYPHAAMKQLPYESEPVSLESMGFTCKALLLTPGQILLDDFISGIAAYATERDRIDTIGTSRLSVALRFGSISIRQVLRWLGTRQAEGIDTEPFFRQLVFRDFYAQLLYHYPTLDSKNFRYRFNGVANDAYFKRFISARTGVPIVDAGIRQLLATGDMHNRVRMIAASFFTKDLLLPWQWGERFFARHLNDYDAASNILSWQWSAGTGIDAQPWFRVFNPYLQSKKFDPEARYIKAWCPELERVAPKILHDETALKRASIRGYPYPIVTHKHAAEEAVKRFQA